MNKKQIDTLRKEIIDDPADLGYAALGQDYPAITARLNARTDVPNPARQDNIPRRLKWGEVLAVMTVDERLALYERPAIQQESRDAIVGADRESITDLQPILGKILSVETQTRLNTLLAETERDPSWTATIPGDSRATSLGLGYVTDSDIQAVMNR